MVLRGVSQPSLRFCQPLEGAGNFMFIYFESCFESGSDSVAFFFPSGCHNDRLSSGSGDGSLILSTGQAALIEEINQFLGDGLVRFDGRNLF